MRFAFVLVTAFVVSAGTASAQEGIVFGAKAGVNFSNISFDEQDVDDEFFGDTSTRTGLLVGVFASVPVNPRFSFQPEFLYIQKGASFEAEGVDGTLKLDYFELPLLADVRLNNGPNRVSLMAGPSFAFRSQAKVEGEGSDDVQAEVDIEDEVEGIDFGFAVGIAVRMRNNVVVDGRYTWGLRNIDKADDSDDATVKNRAFSISVGWRFGPR